MNGLRDVDSVIGAWLKDGPTTLPTDTRRSIVVGLRTQPRAGRTALPGGIAMPSLTRFAAAAAIVLAVGALSVLVISNRNSGVATPSQSLPAAAPSAASGSAPPRPTPTSQVQGVGGWLPFTSARYGYSVRLPVGWHSQPADGDWEMAADHANAFSSHSDRFFNPAGDQVLSAWTMPIPAGSEPNEVTGAACSQAADKPRWCSGYGTYSDGVIEDRPAEIIDRGDGQEHFAFVPVGSTIYAFACWHPEEYAFCETWLTTATLPSSPPSFDTGGWSPFSSTRYAYDARYPTNAAAVQSTRPWSVGEPLWGQSPAEDRFHGGTLQISVFFVDVPTGASRDQWIDGYFDAQFSADPRPPDSGVACPRPRRTTVATEVVDGHPVDFYSGPGGPCGVTYAFVQVGNRLYAFVLWKGGSSEWDLEAFLSTVRFR